MNRLLVLVWLASTIGGTVWLMSEDPELRLFPTLGFSGLVSVLVACGVTLFLKAVFLRKSSA